MALITRDNMALAMKQFSSQYCILFLYILCNFFALANSTRNAPASLELVQILFRHGDRSPTDPFPNDVNNDYWIDGLGELTNIGKEQHLALGQYIRGRYDGFLSERYNNNEIFVRSTDMDRTLMSAYSDLAGLYPPSGDQVWNADIAWQPIPVHTQPIKYDYIVDPDPYCPKDEVIFDQVQVSPALQLINTQYADLYGFLTNQTGYDVHDVFTAGDVYDALFCDRSHNLTIPDWTYTYWTEMEYLATLSYYYQYGLPPLCRLSGGPLVGHMIDNMQTKINGSNSYKVYYFSSHDTKIVAFLSVMGVWDGILPPYASAVFVELHALNDGTHGVQMYYRNDTIVDPYLLQVPGCESPCPIADFISLTQGSVPEDIEKECTMIPTSESIIRELKLYMK